MTKINFKNNKTKTVITFIAAIMIGSVLLSPSTVMPIVNAQQPSKPLGDKHLLYSSIEQKLTGFGGVFVDSSGKLNVYVTDPSKVPNNIQAILSGYIDQPHLERGIIIQIGKEPWHQWAQWEQIASKLFDQKDLGVTEIGIDDKKQELLIGFEELDASKTDQVNTFLAQNQIPKDLVELINTGKLIPTDGSTVRPVDGGVQIGVVGATYLPGWCTIGFVVNSATYGNGLGTTAGHCEASYPNHSQSYTQPKGGSTIGSEVANTNKAPPRYSDLLLFSITVPYNLGVIWEGGSTISIESKAYSQFVGDSVCSYGATSNYQCGSVTQTGLKVYDSGIGGYLYGQNIASMIAHSGDSGAPVYRVDGVTGKAIVYGSVWCCDNTSTYFSPIGGMEFDEGTLQTN